MSPPSVRAQATRLPARALRAVAAVAESRGGLAYLGVLVVFLGLALEGLRRVARWERSRVSG